MLEQLTWVLRRIVGLMFAMTAGAAVAGSSALMHAPFLQQAAVCLLAMTAAFMALRLT